MNSARTPSSGRTRLTYRQDILRGAFNGLLESGWLAFAQLIALRQYDAPPWMLGALVSASFLGLLLNSLSVPLLAKTGMRTARACAWYCYGTGACLFGATLAGNATQYLLFALCAQLLYSQQIPLIAQLYSRNYPAADRGSRVSTSLVLGAAIGIAFAGVGGWLLDIHFAWHRLLLLIMSSAALTCGYAIGRIPSRQLNPSHTGNPIKNLGILRTDTTFGWLLLGWMFIGLANLAALPLRTLLLADPAYGICATNSQIATLTSVVPTLAFMLSIKAWGLAFDRLPFTPLRQAANLFFLVGFACFFLSTHLWIMGLGMALVGIALGGGKIIWGLWITRLAAPQDIPAYMNLHTALTGLRGALAPYLGIWLIQTLGPQGTGWSICLLALLSMGLFALCQQRIRERLDAPPTLKD